jgi:hypothetical protein
VSDKPEKTKAQKKLKKVTTSISRMGRKSVVHFPTADFVTPKPERKQPQNKIKFKLISASALNKIPQRKSVINASPASVQKSMSITPLFSQIVKNNKIKIIKQK